MGCSTLQVQQVHQDLKLDHYKLQSNSVNAELVYSEFVSPDGRPRQQTVIWNSAEKFTN